MGDFEQPHASELIPKGWMLAAINYVNGNASFNGDDEEVNYLLELLDDSWIDDAKKNNPEESELIESLKSQCLDKAFGVSGQDWRGFSLEAIDERNSTTT